MSEQTRAALDDALVAHLADELDGNVVVHWALVSASTSIEDIGTGVHTYHLETGTAQGKHITVGLLNVASDLIVSQLDGGDDD